MLVAHRCLCYCGPARHPCLKESLSPSKIFIIVESIWSHLCSTKDEKLAVWLRPVSGDVWDCKKMNSAGQEQSANHLDKLHYLYRCFLKISFVTFVLKHRRYRISALLFPCTNTTYCLVASQMAFH